MLYDTAIPGFCPKAQLEFISEIAKRIPEQGKIVEVGTLFGRSAYCWAASSPAAATVFCIDIWPGQEITAYTGDSMPDGQPMRLNNTKQQFLSFMEERGVKNVVAINSESPLKEDWPHGPVDVVYIDGLHDYDAVYADAEFWMKHLKTDGLLCGDDYLAEFPDLMRAVGDFAAKHSLEIRRYCKMWLLISPDNRPWLKEAYASLLAHQRTDAVLGNV